MNATNQLIEFLCSAKLLTTDNRPIRLRLAHPDGLFEDALLPQRVSGTESMCGSIQYRIDCLATDAALPLKQFIAVPAELQLVTDRGDLRSISGVVTDAKAGHSDGGLATYQLVIRDALSIMEHRVNTRVFRNASEIDIIETLFDEWKQKNSIIASAFHVEIDQQIFARQYPKREFTKQHNESDAAFLRRLMRRRGIAWFFRSGRPAGKESQPGDDDTPAHTIVLFNDAGKLQENRAGELRFHRDDATEERDSVTSLVAVRVLRPSSVSRHSWNYMNPRSAQFMTTNVRSAFDQGPAGNIMSASLDDYLVEAPHVGDDHEDHAGLGQLRLARHDMESKCFVGESSVRDLCIGEFNSISGHHELDQHAEQEREFVITELSIAAENNLGSADREGIRKLFARNHWDEDSVAAGSCEREPGGAVRYKNSFVCVRRGVQLVPAYDPRTEVPIAQIESAVVVGPPGEKVHCDALGRVKVRFTAALESDHAHASGAGASGTDVDSAWVRVMSNWASPISGECQPGALTLPRVGSEVLIAYAGGDPDKPVIIGQMYNHDALPPALNNTGGLPGNRFISGMQSGEVNGNRHNQIRFDDTPGEISAQLASDHGASELNLGRLTQHRHDGKGTPRGDGAELRSDNAVTVRGAQGVLLSAAGREGAHGRLLDREELLGLVEMLGSVTKELSSLAAAHDLDDPECPHTAKLQRLLQAWDDEKTTAPASPSGAPILAATAPAGIVVASEDALSLGAANKVDVVSIGDSAISAGRKLLMRATDSIGAFALKLGMKLVAAGGDIEVQAEDGNIQLVALKRLKLCAGEGIDIHAPEVRLVTQGAQTDWTGGKITQQCKGEFAIKAAKFLRTGPGGGTPDDVLFPKSELKTDERIIVREQQTGRPIKGMRYTARFEDGRVESGVTDDHGYTQVFQGTDFGNIEITFDDE